MRNSRRNRRTGRSRSTSKGRSRTGSRRSTRTRRRRRRRRRRRVGMGQSGREWEIGQNGRMGVWKSGSGRVGSTHNQPQNQKKTKKPKLASQNP